MQSKTKQTNKKIKGINGSFDSYNTTTLRDKHPIITLNVIMALSYWNMRESIVLGSLQPKNKAFTTEVQNKRKQKH